MVGTRAATSDWEEVGDQWRLVVMEDRTLASSRHWPTIRLFLIIFLVFISYVYSIDIFMEILSTHFICNIFQYALFAHAYQIQE